MEHRQMGGTSPSMLGLGCMRFPLDPIHNQLDEVAATAMIHRAMEAGITYYDTAVPYHQGQSEGVVGRALAPFPRDRYYLATKLPCWEITSRAQAIEVFHQQLERLQTDYVDFYLLHALSRKTWNNMLKLDVLSAMDELVQAGKIRQLGFSFHDEYAVFEEILTYRPWDFCQIQLNYIDVNHQAGLKGLNLAQSMGIPVVIMEPVRGGSLAVLPETVTKPLQAISPETSPATWAMRWIYSQPGVAVVLSGMSNMEQLEENIGTFSHVVPLSLQEEKAMAETTKLLQQRIKNGCTACNYCMPCPAGVDIPGNFAVWNSMGMFENGAYTQGRWNFLSLDERANLCHGCGRCETLCPQRIPIRDHLRMLSLEIPEFIGESTT